MGFKTWATYSSPVSENFTTTNLSPPPPGQYFCSELTLLFIFFFAAIKWRIHLWFNLYLDEARNPWNSSLVNMYCCSVFNDVIYRNREKIQRMPTAHVSGKNTASTRFLKSQFSNVEKSDLRMSIYTALDWFFMSKKPKLMLKLRDWVSSCLREVLRT